MLIDELPDTSVLDSKIERLLAEINDINQQIRDHIQKNATEAQNQDEYTQEYHILERKYKKKAKAINIEKKHLIEQMSKVEQMTSFIRIIENTDETLPYFDDDIWRTVIEKATVFHDGRIVFQFLDGSEVAV